MIILYYNTISIDHTRHVHYHCFSLYLVEGKVDAPGVAHVDGTLSMLHMSIIHYIIRSRFVAGGCF